MLFIFEHVLTAFPGDAINTPLLSSTAFSIGFCDEIVGSTVLLGEQLPCTPSSSPCDTLLSNASSTCRLTGVDEALLKFPDVHHPPLPLFPLLPLPLTLMVPRQFPFGLGLLLPSLERDLALPKSGEPFEGTGGGSWPAAPEDPVSAMKLCS